jgi:Kef-type K+ transport system membrane component KefB/mannitol/fructose-specific phosphotransferase system IIA component (Ntr-type)
MAGLPLSEPIAVFAIAAALVLVAPSLADRFKAAALAFLLVAGALLGPGGAGALGSGGLLEGLGRAGLAYAAFLAGLETELALIRKGRGQGMALGAMSAVLAFAAGFSGGRFLLGFAAPPALLLGALLSANSLIGYAAVQRFGLSRNRAAGAASTASILANVIAVAAFSAITAAAGAGDVLHWAVAGGVGALLAFAAAFALPRFSAYYLKRVKPEGNAEFAYALLILFGLAWASGSAGLGPLAGAFAAGIAFNSLIPEKSVLMTRLRFVGNVLLLPFFYIYAGTLVDLRSLADPVPALSIAAFLLLAALAAKGLPALALRISGKFAPADATLVFGIGLGQSGLNLAVIALGASSSLLPAQAVSGAAIALIVLSLVGPLLSSQAAKRLAMGSSSAPGQDAERGERVMAIVSNPEHAQALVDLAFLIDPRDSRHPIYAANIIQDPADAERGLSASERVLSKIVVSGVAAGIDVIPVTKVSYNVSEGLVQAASELRASTIVAGAGPESQFMKRPYGQVIDLAVSSTRQLFIILRSTVPVNLLSHVVAVVPPLSERQAGFTRAAAAVKALARGIKAKVTLLTLNHALEAVSAEWERTRPQIPFQRAGAETWKDVLAELDRYPQATTLFALFNVRQGSLAWQPAVDKLPLAFLGRAPKASLLCVYVPEPRDGEAEAVAENGGEADGAEAKADADLLSDSEEKGRVLLWPQPLALADAVRALIKAAFPEDRQAQTRLSALFTDIAQKEPVELAPGIALLHAHVGEAAEPILLWGISRTGIPTLALEEKLRVLIVLLAPEGQPPEEHLRMLSRLASSIMESGFAARLESAGPGR